MATDRPTDSPSAAEMVQVLRDGYWDRTELIRLADGSLRVRKAAKPAANAGPWGRLALGREIRYLQDLSGPAAGYFPALLAAWGDGDGDSRAAGYEMSFIADSRDVGAIAQTGQASQAQADQFQDALGRVLFELVHTPAEPGPSLAAHVRDTLLEVLAELAREEQFQHLIGAESVTINDRPMAGAHLAVKRLCDCGQTLAALDSGPWVRLHGDCFLENILLPKPNGAQDRGMGVSPMRRGAVPAPHSSTGETPVPRKKPDADWPSRLTLVDPVSVAGVCRGHPLFDLVKYESYATGELPALRWEKVEARGFDPPAAGPYSYRVLSEDPAIRPFAQINWHGRLRQAYLARYGELPLPLYRLLEGYFALVMALCTHGLQRQARLLKATISLNQCQ